MVTVEELVRTKSRAELEAIYFGLVGARCACCKTKADVAKHIVYVMRGRNLSVLYDQIVV